MEITDKINGLFTDRFRRDDTTYPTKYYWKNEEGAEVLISANAGYVMMDQDATINDVVNRLIRVGQLADDYNTSLREQRTRANELSRATALNGKMIGRKFWELCKRNGIGETEFDEFLSELNDDLSYMTIKRTSEYTVRIKWEPTFEQEYTVEAADEDEAEEKAAELFSLRDIKNNLEDYFDETDLEFDIEED